MRKHNKNYGLYVKQNGKSTTENLRNSINCEVDSRNRYKMAKEVR